MSLLSIDEIKTLVEQSQGTCVSIYSPTHRAGAETRQNAIRFKNLIKQAETPLKEYELNQTDASKLLQLVLQLDKEDFWQHQDEGLAIFLAERLLRCYRLPLKFEELVVVIEPDKVPNHALLAAVFRY